MLKKFEELFQNDRDESNCVNRGSPKKENQQDMCVYTYTHTYIYLYKFIMRDWLTL